MSLAATNCRNNVWRIGEIFVHNMFAVTQRNLIFRLTFTRPKSTKSSLRQRSWSIHRVSKKLCQCYFL